MKTRKLKCNTQQTQGFIQRLAIEHNCFPDEVGDLPCISLSTNQDDEVENIMHRMIKGECSAV